MQVRSRYHAILLATLFALSVAPCASADDQRLQSPRWMVELKGGQFEPDLDDYETFYGAAEIYADVLGEAGLAEYRCLAVEA